ncbi:hypothetical protein KPSB59_4660002 [Klebsiella quasipneumoniae subsp. quasipneumoniae]|nr:hypothetical protein KPSB59_4660002 [Klebsiella quasipneumoniae subsp. quasipneumoniae]
MYFFFFEFFYEIQCIFFFIGNSIVSYGYHSNK